MSILFYVLSFYCGSWKQFNWLLYYWSPYFMVQIVEVHTLWFKLLKSWFVKQLMIYVAKLINWLTLSLDLFKLWINILMKLIDYMFIVVVTHGRLQPQWP
jgi:hypothetical protein